MSAKNASQDTSANPTKDSPTCPGRDTREGAHTESEGEQSNNPPNHGLPTHGAGRFLWEVDKRTPVDELGELYTRWQDDSEQVDLGRWSE